MKIGWNEIWPHLDEWFIYRNKKLYGVELPTKEVVEIKKKEAPRERVPRAPKVVLNFAQKWLRKHPTDEEKLAMIKEEKK